MRSLSVAAACAVTSLFVGCSSAPPASPPSAPAAPSAVPASSTAAATPTPAPSPTKAPTPTPTAQATVAPSTAPSLSGQLIVGRVTAFDNTYGPIAALNTYRADGTLVASLTNGGSAFPAWSPDGKRVAYTTHMPDGSWQIASMAADGSDVKVRTTGPINEVPSWSPDGTWIAYDSSSVGFDDSSFHTSLYRMNADGSNPKLFGEPDTFDVEPRISPDGKSVLFERLTFPSGDQNNILVVRDLVAGTERVVEAVGTSVEHANWSPDGKWIVYDVCSCMNHSLPGDQLERIAADGSGEPTVLVKGTTKQGAFKPWYSPDGTAILFGCTGTNGDSAACIVDADGSNLRIFVDTRGVDEQYFSWGVDPHN